MLRRTFLKNSLLATAALPTSHQILQMLQSGMKLKKVGIQLFSLPKMLDQDFLGGVKMLANMGYKELELYGPYPFSAQSNQERWKFLAPMLGFSGSGYFGRTIQEVKQILKDHGLTAPSAHTDLDTLLNHMDKLGEAAQTLGHKYVVLPAIPDERRKTLDDYKRVADDFNKIGENAQKHGLRFAYHNHGYGLSPMNGQVPFELLMAQTDPNLVFLEMDIYWTSAGGIDPLAYLDKYNKRYKALHIKDMKEPKRFAGDGGDAPQWMALFPYMCSVGDGVLNVANIIKKAQSVGVEHFFVEQDMVAQPEIALKKSIDYLR